MPNTRVLAAFLATTVAVAGGSAWAASQDASASPPAQTATQKDFGKLSADGARGYQDLTLARLAIYDGKTDQAKKFIGEADQAFTKAKTDDSVFMKAEHEMMTPQQMADKTAKKTPDQAKASTDAAQPASSDTKPAADNLKPIAWLPVDGAISLNEDYTMNPAKTKAVADANKSLAKGDKKGAIDRLKLAEVDTSVVLEVVPLNQTISDVHQAAQMIDAGKYYEGSQALRAVQTSARYNALDLVSTPKAGAASNAGDSKAATH